MPGRSVATRICCWWCQRSVSSRAVSNQFSDVVSTAQKIPVGRRKGAEEFDEVLIDLTDDRSAENGLGAAEFGAHRDVLRLMVLSLCLSSCKHEKRNEI
jgi:hypothetical protein